MAAGGAAYAGRFVRIGDINNMKEKYIALNIKNNLVYGLTILKCEFVKNILGYLILIFAYVSKCIKDITSLSIFLRLKTMQLTPPILSDL